MVGEAWGQHPRSGQQRPQGRTPGSTWLPLGQPQCPHPCTRISHTHLHTHLHTYLTHPCTLPCTHSAPFAPAPQGEMWKWLTGGSNGQLLQDAVAGRGCGGRMRFQTLRSRGGAGEGPSRDRGCCCLGDAGGGTGALASAAAAALPLCPPIGAVRGGGVGGSSLTRTPLTLTPPHCGRADTWPAEPWLLLGLGVSRLPPRPRSGAQTFLLAPLGLAFTPAEEGLLMSQRLKPLGRQLS